MLIYIAVMVTLTFILFGLDVAVTVAISRKKIDSWMRERSDEEVTAAAEREKKDLMDEGIENIMSYSVNGKTGFERD